MNVRKLGRRLDAWHDRTERRLAALPWWGRPIDIAFGVVTAVVVIPLVFLAAGVGNLILLAPFIGASLLLAYLTDVEDAGLIAWGLFVVGCMIFGVARWAVRELRGRAD